MIEIKNRWTNEVIYRSETAETLRAAVIEAVSSAANLSAANLSAANLRAANLSAANLRDANLSAADLSAADLSAAKNLSLAKIDSIKADFWMVLTYAKNEVRGLLEKLRAGEIDGSKYEGDCACLVGTIANIRHCHYNEVSNIKPDPSRPSEIWFMALRRGNKPDNLEIAKITESWIEEWLSLQAERVVAP